MNKRLKKVAIIGAAAALAWGVIVFLYDQTVIENDYEIKRTPEDVYDFMIDMRNESKWNPSLVSMEKITDSPLGVGTQFRAQWKGSPVIIVTCTRAERPNQLEFDNGGAFSAELSISLAAAGTGTKVHSRMNLHPTGGARLVFPIFAQLFRHEEEGVPQNITRQLERPEPKG